MIQIDFLYMYVVQRLVQEYCLLQMLLDFWTKFQQRY